MLDRPSSPDPRQQKAAFLHAQVAAAAPPTLRSLTGSDFFPPSPHSPSGSEKRYSRANILLFRAATGEERALPPTEPDLSLDDHPPLDYKPRISSVTDSTPTDSPDRTHVSLQLGQEAMHCAMREPVDTSAASSSPPQSPVDDDACSTYSHASAINLEDLDDDDLAGLRLHGLGDADAPPIINRQVLERRRQSFANSFAKARQAKADRKAVVLARPELQPQHKHISLIDRCIRAITEALDLNLNYSKAATDKFHAFSSLFTRDERQVIGELLREASARLRNETPTPWRSPIHWSNRRPLLKSSAQAHSTHQLSGVFRSQRNRRNPKVMTSDTLVRSVVFGSHIIPGVQSAESILMRMAGEYQREEVNRKASRAERIDIPLSFAMTLTAALAVFARLECNASYRRYRSRSASNRRSNPQALIMIKTKYDGLKLSFAVTLHGESPCTVLFRRPRIFSPRKIDDYATLVTEAKDIMTEFGREVIGPRD